MESKKTAGHLAAYLRRLKAIGYKQKLAFIAAGLCGICLYYLLENIAPTVKISVYIYMVSVITVATSVLILHEQLTLSAGIGTILTLAGLFLSEHKTERKGAEDGLAE